MYQIGWNEEGILVGTIPSTKEIPCFVMPPLGNEILGNTENYIKQNHPKTLYEAIQVTRHLMKVISDASIEVSPEFDFEFIQNC
jgi:hypothetical protein